MNKHIVFTLGIFVFLIISLNNSVIAAEFNANAGFEWLNKTIQTSDWNKEIDEVSLSILALNTANYNTNNGIEKLLARQKTDGSWNERVYDTSLAILALYKNNKDVNDSINWLLDQEQEASVQGNWLIQIKTDYTGTDASCDVSVGNNEAVRFNVNKTGVSCDFDGNGDDWGNWIDIEKCLNVDLGKHETIDINCNNLGNADLSLIYKFENNYYLMAQKDNTNRWSDLELDNAYFGDYETTAYTSFVLKEIGMEDRVHTLSYLRSNSRSNNVLDRAFLYYLTNSKSYITWLETKQNNLTGSWDGNIYNTAFTTLLIRDSGSSSREKAISWLKGEQNTREGSSRYGSWNNDVLDTAISLYAINFKGIIKPPIKTNVTNFTSAYCGDLLFNINEECDAEYDLNGDITNGDDDECGTNERCVAPGKLNECTCKSIGETCNTDSDCNEDEECDSLTKTCKAIERECTANDECMSNTDCRTNEECDQTTCTCEPKSIQEECTDDSDCETGEQCIEGGCQAIPGYCEIDEDCFEGEVCDTETNRCVEKKGFPWWIITLIVLVIALVAVYYFYKKKSKPKLIKQEEPYKDFMERRQGPIMRPGFMTKQPTAPIRPAPQMPRRGYRDEQLEKELDESLRKAKELIGKGKKEK